MNDDKRQFVHGLWSSVAESWIERADYLEERGASVTKTILERAAIARADDVLALADGAGGMAFAAAPYARHAVSSDVVPTLVDAARRRAHERGLTNVTAQVVDIEEIDAADESFDVAISREGLMFAVDPQRAFNEIARVLRPGGRLAAAVWGAPDANPWLAFVITAGSEAVGHPVPPPGMPGPFALSDAHMLAALAAGAGFVDFAVDEVEVPFCVPSVDAWIAHTAALAGPVANIINGFDAATAATFHARLHELATPYASTDGLELPGVSLVLSARRAT